MSSDLTFHVLDSLLRGNINWDVTKKGLEVTSVDYGSKNFKPAQLIAPASLNALHPEMHTTLLALRKEVNAAMRRDYHGGLRRDHTDGRYPRACIRSLCAPLVVQDVRGHTAALAYVWDVSWTTEDMRVTLHTMSYDMPCKDAVVSRDTPATPSRVSSQQMRVTKEWMDDTFPGWENRMHSGLALGLEQEDLVDHICAVGVHGMAISPPPDISPG